MSTTSFMALACPLDGAPLERGDGAWRCGAGHSFDIARQGYGGNEGQTRPGGELLLVDAGLDHLRELREIHPRAAARR